MGKSIFERLHLSLSRTHDLSGRCRDATHRAGLRQTLHDRLITQDFQLKEPRKKAQDGELARSGTHYGVLLTLRQATTLSRPERRRLAHLRGEGRMTDERGDLEARDLIGSELPGLPAGQQLLLPVTGLEDLIGETLQPVTVPTPVTQATALEGWVRTEEDGHSIFLEVQGGAIRVDDRRPDHPAPEQRRSGSSGSGLSRTHLMLATALIGVAARPG